MASEPPQKMSETSKTQVTANVMPAPSEETGQLTKISQEKFLATGGIIVALAATVLTAGMGFAAEKTVTLAVENMSCASCPYIVKKTLVRVTGVTKVDVSFGRKTAMVAFDDTRTSIEALTDATFDASYPSELAK